MCSGSSSRASMGSGSRSGARSAGHRVTQPSSPLSAPARADDLAGRRQLVQHRRRVVSDAGREDQPFQRRGRNHGARQLLHDAEHSVDALERSGGRAADRLPRRQQQRQRLRRHRLGLLAQRRHGAAAYPAQHLGVAPLGPRAAGPELARQHAARGGQALQGGDDRRCRDAEARRGLDGGNGPCVRAYRATRSPSGSATTAVKASGTPTGSGTPSASCSRPASSIAAQRSSEAMRTLMTRRAPSRSTRPRPG